MGKPRLARFDARDWEARQEASRAGRRSAPACSRCGACAPLYRRPRQGCERTYPLAEGQLQPPLCGLCLDGIGGQH